MEIKYNRFNCRMTCHFCAGPTCRNYGRCENCLNGESVGGGSGCPICEYWQR